MGGRSNDNRPWWKRFGDTPQENQTKPNAKKVPKKGNAGGQNHVPIRKPGKPDES